MSSKKDIVIAINGGVLRMDEAFYTGMGETYESLQDEKNLGSFLAAVGMFVAVGNEGLAELRAEFEAAGGVLPDEFEDDDGDGGNLQ